MRFDDFSAAGLIPFPERIYIDFSAIAGKLVALVGPNGAGKSSILEGMMATIERRCPTRGPLSELAMARDSYVQSSIVNGAPWKLRQSYDAVGGKGSSLVTDAAGKAVLPSTGVAAFDVWRKKHLPPKEVLEAALWRHQRSRGFIGMEESDRQALILRVVGVEAIEKKAEAARKRRGAKKAELDMLVQRIRDERERGLEIATAESKLAEATARAEDADKDLAIAKAELADAEERRALVAKVIAERQATVATFERLGDELNDLERKIADLDLRIANNERVLATSDAIRAAVERQAALRAEVERLRTQDQASDKRRLGHQHDAAMARATKRDADVLLKAAQDRLARAEKRLQDWALVNDAEAKLPDLRVLLEDAEKNAAEKQARVDEWAQAKLGVAEKRIGVLRPAMDQLSAYGDRTQNDHAEYAVDVACDAIHSDNNIQQHADMAPMMLEESRKDLALARSAVQRAEKAVRDAAALAARAGEMKTADGDVLMARGDIAQCEDDGQAALVRIAAAESADQALLVEVTALRAKIEPLLQEEAELAPLLAKAGPLGIAETRLSELRPQHAELTAKKAAIAEQLGSLVLPTDDPPADVALGPYEARVASLETKVRGAHVMVKVAEAQLAQAHESAKKLAGWEADRAPLEQDLADWTLLAEALGVDGVQSLMVDSAGPELTAITNDLLHSSFGSRWTVTIETTKQSSDGKKQLECCEFRVFDEVDGVEKKGERLSEGQAVPVNEAISLAFAVLLCRRWGIEDVDLIRDEAGAALDPSSARNYIRMLRRACEMVSISHVYFVSHDPQIQELADARILVSDGKVQVMQ